METQKGRYFKGKANVPGLNSEKRGMEAYKTKWRNPLKGGYADIASAEVTAKSAGIFVGFKIHF